MKINIFDKIKRIKNEKLRYKILAKILDFNIPFNRRLKFKIIHLSPKKVQVLSPAVTARQNHIKGAHACALATMGEYPAGLVLAQNFSPQEFRFILKELHMSYEKQGHGQLMAECEVKVLTAPHKTKETWYDMISIINNKKNGELIATCKTKWQVKPWNLIKTSK